MKKSYIVGYVILSILSLLLVNSVCIDWTTKSERSKATYNYVVTSGCLDEVGWYPTSDCPEQWEEKFQTCLDKRTTAFKRWSQADTDTYYYKHVAEWKRRIVIHR